MKRTWPWKDPETSSLCKASNKCEVPRAGTILPGIKTLGLKRTEQEKRGREKGKRERHRSHRAQPCGGERTLCILRKCNKCLCGLEKGCDLIWILTLKISLWLQKEQERMSRQKCKSGHSPGKKEEHLRAGWQQGNEQTGSVHVLQRSLMI